MKRIIALLAAALASPAVGQPAAPATPPAAAPAEELDPAAVEAARALLAATDFDSQLEQSAQMTAQGLFTTALASLEAEHGSDFPPDLETELRLILVEHTENFVADLRRTALEDCARIYARHFTVDEIRELQRLQTHPVMVKFQRIGPQLMTELAQIGFAAELPHLPELRRRLGEAVQAWRVRQARHGETPRT